MEVEVFASEIEHEWNCRKTILYLRPRAHNRQIRKNASYYTTVLLMNTNYANYVNHDTDQLGPGY